MEEDRSPKAKVKRGGFIKTFFAGFLVCGAGLDLLGLIFNGATNWALEHLLAKAVGSAIASVLTLLVKLIIKIILQSKGGTTVKAFFKKIGAFFVRVFKYLKSNKVTLGGIITSIITGAIGTTVSVCGYKFDVMAILCDIPQLEWAKEVNIAGFNLMPIIAGVIIWLVAIWNAAAAVKRGWESPEQYEAVKAEQTAKKKKAVEVSVAATVQEKVQQEENPVKPVQTVDAEELHRRKVEELKAKLKAG